MLELDLVIRLLPAVNSNAVGKETRAIGFNVPGRL